MGISTQLPLSSQSLKFKLFPDNAGADEWLGKLIAETRIDDGGYKLKNLSSQLGEEVLKLVGNSESDA